MKFAKCISVFFLFLCVTTMAFAQDLAIRAQWDYDLATPGLAGFRLYNNGLSVFDTNGLALQADCSVPQSAYKLGLNGFTMTAYDVGGMESAHSPQYPFVIGFTPSNEDTDSDGVADWWEIAAHTNPFINDAAADSDGDGISNIAEFAAATNTVSGRVVNEQGNSLAGIWIEAISVATGITHAGQTDLIGNFVLPVLRLRDYKVMAVGSGSYRDAYFNNSNTWAEAQVLDLSQTSAAQIDFTLRQGRIIAGTINNLAAGDTVQVEVWSESAQSWDGLLVHGTGEPVAFTLRGLADAADYRLSIDGANYKNGYLQRDPAGIKLYKQENDNIGPWDLSALLPAGTEGVEIFLAAGKEITGTLAGLGIGEEAWVEAWSDAAGFWSGSRVAATSTDPQAYSIDGLIDAVDIMVHVQAQGYLNGWYAGTPGAAASVPVTMSKATKLNNTILGDIAGVHIQMIKGTAIGGTVFGLEAGETVSVAAMSASQDQLAVTRVAGLGGGADAYLLDGLPAAADYSLFLSADKYTDGFYCVTGICPEKDATLISTVAGNVTGINFTLVQGQTIAGKIANLAAGEEALVEAWSEATWNWGYAYVIGSGAEVAYTITGLTAATDFAVKVTPKLHQAAIYPTSVDSSLNPAGINFQLVAGWKISGTVTGARPTEKVFLEAWSPSTGISRRGWATANNNGIATYAIDGLGAYKDYVVSAGIDGKHLFYSQSPSVRNALAIDLSNGNATAIDFNLAALSTAKITGTIAGLDPLVQTLVKIDVWDEATGVWKGAEHRDNGDFLVEAPIGHYKIAFYAQGYADIYYSGVEGGTTSLTSARTVDLRNDGLAIGTVTLAKAYSVSGTVYFDANLDGAGQNSEVLAGAALEITGNSIAKNVIADNKGNFAIKGLPAGEYVLKSNSIQGRTQQTVVIGNADVAVVVLCGQATSGSISGTLRLSGKPVKDGIIMIFAEDGLFINAMTTDKLGNYLYGGLTAGTYTVKADVDGDFSVDTTLAVSVVAGAATVQNFDIIR